MARNPLTSHTSFGGADLVVTFANRTVGELQQISWAVQREKAPVFTLGSPDPRSFSRGKRGIAGSLVFAVFDRDALVEELRTQWSNIAPAAMFTAAGNAALKSDNSFSAALTLAGWNLAANQSQPTGDYSSGTFQLVNPATGAVDSTNGYATMDFGSGASAYQTEKADGINVPAGFTTIQGPQVLYADMLPPFDCTMTFANEYGNAAFQRIYDMDIMNESSGVSVDSIVMERQLTYVARRLSPIITGVFNRNSAAGAGLSGQPVIRPS